LKLKETYTNLAAHYSRLGGYEAAIRFLKNVLEKDDDPQLRHQLAILEGSVAGYDFINSFTKLLKDRPYDLNLTLEFCYFLEGRNLHEAALDTLETELRKRLRLSTPPDLAEASIIDGFFILLQAQITIEEQIRLQDYKRIIAANFPEEIVKNLQIPETTLDATIIGHELEEYESEYGLKDELKWFFGLALFFAEHYPIPVSTAFVSILLIGLTVFHVPAQVVEHIGTAGCFLLLSFLLFELIRPLRLKDDARLKAHTKVCRAAIVASFVMIVLGFLGPRMMQTGGNFFSPLAVKAMSAVLVASLLWRTHLAMASIRRSLTRIRANLIQALTRRAFRRQLAGMVAGTSKWVLLLTWVLSLQTLSRARLSVAAFAVAHTIFLSACWRWGYLEAHAEKQKLRDSLVFIIAITFVILIVIQFADEVPLWTIVLSLSFDGTLLLGTAIVFALQITSLNLAWLYGCGVVFAFLNFATIFDHFGFTFLTTTLFGDHLALVSLSGQFVLAILLCLLGIIVAMTRSKSDSHFTHTEVHMESKYKILGGQQVVVGDSGTASNFTQVGQSSASNIDLSSLADELAILREALRSQAQEPGHFTALSEVTSAEKAAREGNGPVALEHLKKAGAWVWDVATKIGIGVATAAAKAALGF
jgi:hypothetical protein